MPKPINPKEWEDYIKENLKYDPETGYLWWTKPSESKHGKRLLNRPVGTFKGGYYYLSLASKRLLCHRVAWFLYYNSWPKDMLDHINGIKDDNRIENLREATRNQNGMNTKKRDDCSSKHKGVRWDERRQKWKTQIHIDQRQKYLGRYTSEEEAARAYDKAARELFGDYACLNFPDEHEQGALNGHDV